MTIISPFWREERERSPCKNSKGNFSLRLIHWMKALVLQSLLGVVSKYDLVWGYRVHRDSVSRFSGLLFREIARVKKARVVQNHGFIIIIIKTMIWQFMPFTDRLSCDGHCGHCFTEDAHLVLFTSRGSRQSSVPYITDKKTAAQQDFVYLPVVTKPKIVAF